MYERTRWELFEAVANTTRELAKAYETLAEYSRAIELLEEVAHPDNPEALARRVVSELESLRKGIIAMARPGEDEGRAYGEILEAGADELETLRELHGADGVSVQWRTVHGTSRPVPVHALVFRRAAGPECLRTLGVVTSATPLDAGDQWIPLEDLARLPGFEGRVVRAPAVDEVSDDHIDEDADVLMRGRGLFSSSETIAQARRRLGPLIPDASEGETP